MKVLVIEDVPSLAHVLAQKFNQPFRTHFVTTSEGTEAALKANGPFDALVIDVLLNYDNDESGVALYDLVRHTLHPETKVLMIGHARLVPDNLHHAMMNRGLPFVDLNHFNPATQLR